MRHLYSMLIILAVSFAGELLAAVIPIAVPGCIYGMVLMLIGLMTGIIPHERVKATGKFLIEIMPVMFIPSAVGLMKTWPALQGMLLPFFIAAIPLTFVIMGVTGWVTQAISRRQERRRKDEADPS